MRVVFLHGIAQQGKNSAQIKSEWLDAIGNPAFLQQADVVAPFYGDILAELSRTTTTAQAIAQGLGENDEERQFVIEAMQEISQHVAVAKGAMSEEEQAIAQGPWDDRRFLAFVRFLERVVPLQSTLVLPLVRQAFVYLRKPEVTDAVDGQVLPALTAGPCVVVGHSLGSIVGFKLLRQLGQTIETPLFMTLGSPLGIDAVKAALARPRLVPKGVKRWFNGLDPNDLVTLGKSLTPETFADGIVNKANIDNHAEPHAIRGYFADPDVRAEIRAVV